MKRLGSVVFCLVAFFLMTAPTAVEKSRDIFVNGKFLISSYTVEGRQVVQFKDLARLIAGAGTFTINAGKLQASVGPAMATMVKPSGRGLGLKVKGAATIGNVLNSGGQQWVAVSDLIKAIGGTDVTPNGVATTAPLQIRVFDCPDVHCCPDCGIAIRSF